MTAVMSLDEMLVGLDLSESDLIKLALVKVGGVQQDSRKIKAGDCFIAVTGVESDGREYVEAAIEAGAVAVIQQAPELEGLSVKWQQLPIVNVPNLLQKMSLLAGNFYRHPCKQLALIGVTGTNGKTSCAQLLSQILSRLQMPASMVGTMGYGLVDKSGESRLNDTGMTTPDAVRCQHILNKLSEEGAQAAVLEVSSHALVQGRVAALEFSQALFTNLSRDHLDYHGSMESYGEAKASLFASSGLRTAVINADDELGRQLLERDHPYLKTSYSLNNPEADVYLSKIQYRSDGLRACLHSPWGQAEIHSHLLGTFNLYNLLAVIAAACAQGFDFDSVIAQVDKLKPVVGRMQLLSTASGASKKITAIIDYAHTPDALNKALAAVRQHCNGRVWCVFGCGGDRDKGKRPLMMAEALAQSDHVVVTSDNPRYENPSAIIADVMQGKKESTEGNHLLITEVNRYKAIARAMSLAADGDSILIAGKGHETYQKVGAEILDFDDVLVAKRLLAEFGSES